MSTELLMMVRRFLAIQDRVDSVEGFDDNLYRAAKEDLRGMVSNVPPTTKLAAEHAEMLAALKSMYEPGRDPNQGRMWICDLIKRIEPDYVDPWVKLGEEIGDYP